MSSSEMSLVSAVLGLRSKARTAQPGVQEKVKNLKGILDLTAILVPDWRRGHGTPGPALNAASGANPTNYGGGAYHNKFRRNQGPMPYKGPTTNNPPFHKSVD